MRIRSQLRGVPAAGMACRAQGFTLVELLVTLAIVVILSLFAIPNFKNIVNSYRLDAAANAMIGALNTARMAAVQRNAPAQFCSNVAATNTSDTLGSACGANIGEVFVLTANSSGATTTQLAQAPPQLGVSTIYIHGTAAAIRYNSQGLGYAPGATTPYDSTVVDICSTALSTNNHIQINMAAGSIVSTTPASSSSTDTCP